MREKEKINELLFLCCVFGGVRVSELLMNETNFKLFIENYIHNLFKMSVVVIFFRKTSYRSRLKGVLSECLFFLFTQLTKT